MKFKPTRKEFVLADDSGYSFVVTLTYDEDSGWGGRIAFASGGYRNEIGALSALRTAIEQYLRMSKNAEL